MSTWASMSPTSRASMTCGRHVFRSTLAADCQIHSGFVDASGLLHRAASDKIVFGDIRKNTFELKQIKKSTTYAIYQATILVSRFSTSSKN